MLQFIYAGQGWYSSRTDVCEHRVVNNLFNALQILKQVFSEQ